MHGRSYVISISPSQRNYTSKKKLYQNTPPGILKKRDEFKIEEQYENRGQCKVIRYKKNWHPVFCQSATLNRLDNHLYLIGGVSHAIVEQVCFLTPKEGEYHWGILCTKEPILQRYGHTCNVYEDKLVIFGGQRGASNKKTRRIVLNDLWIYSPERQSLDQILSKRCPDLRYGHCACIAGDFLVIYGGMNEMGEVLRDVCIMNLYTK